MEVSQHRKYFCEFCGKEYKYLDEYEEEVEEQEEDVCGKEEYEEEKTKQLPKELLEYLQVG
ncbi:hypothetical protein KY290_001717 [Solanum tuberosum]|uniref:Uncharacterized protein n=1 Tax=Solanum tuberosum TaxID=4113 RepID=A0ABQ7WN48_SOLTU|nr:hypothetical protein KY284_001756 [Solanum tuberosum]KAH0782119.1 hypothetical protein KY290_001717 [Solanum tuberosum]